MSDEQTVTIAEVREALKVAYRTTSETGLYDAVLSQLRKPPIHTNVPVMYRYDGYEPERERLSFHCQLDPFDDSNVNIRVLIPEATVMEWVRAYGANHNWFASKIADYKKNGPSDE